MTKQEVVALVCKLMGIYTFILGLQSLPVLFLPMWVSLTNGPGVMNMLPRPLYLLNVIPVGIYFVAAILLWKGAGRLSGHIVTCDGTPLGPIRVSRDIQAVAFTFLGLNLIVFSMPQAVEILEHIFMEGRLSASLHPAFQASIAPEVTQIVIQLALGLWLLFGASGLVKLLHSFDAAKPPENPV
ncbi:MAG: hypothetical protein M3Y56_08410 [Armatimonadota bacterium]|nr:hypothetical protein [Armatimonadota bacterium]